MEKLINTTEQETAVNWIRPDLENETGEIKRVLETFLSEEPTEENIDKIKKLLDSSPLLELSDEEWEALENTDSFHNVRPGQIEEAQKITEEYNKELSPETKRNFQRLLDGFRQDNSIEAPTILKKAGKLHLVSGNTRLMIARVLGIRPKVIIGEVS